MTMSMTKLIARLLLLTTLVLSVGAGVAAAQTPKSTRYAVLIQGASGEEQYATLHRGWLDGLAQLLREHFKFDAAQLSVLAEQAQAGEQRSTAENVRALFARLGKEVTPADLVLVVLIGHGGGQGADAKFNLIGPDLTIAEWSELLKPIAGRVALVDTTSSSFAFLAGLAAPNRIVITATNSHAQRYHTMFPDAFIKALTADAADVDKNQRVSLLEAFTYASRLVAQHYEQDGRLPTERAMFDDTGDGKGRDAVTEGPDGTVAGLTYLDVPEAATSSDPAIQQLLTRQQQLVAEVDELRRRRPSMPPAEFDREFEKLIVELSLVSRDIRRKGK
jgi:hypothetical protein